jgi:hypothetical protein
MQEDIRGYHIDLENLEIRIGGDCPNFFTAKTMLVECAKNRLVEAERAVQIALQNQGTQGQAGSPLNVATQELNYAHQDFIRANQQKNPYRLQQPYEDLGFAPHGPLTVLNFNCEG